MTSIMWAPCVLVLAGAFQADSQMQALAVSPSGSIAKLLEDRRAAIRASSFVQTSSVLGTTARKGCDKDCEQNKDLDKLDEQAAKGKKMFDKLKMVATQVQKIVDENDKLLSENTKLLKKSIKDSKGDWTEVNELLREMITQYKEKHQAKFAAQSKQVSSTAMAVAALFQYEKAQFTELKDNILSNAANVKDYLKSQATLTSNDVAGLDKKVEEMKQSLTQEMTGSKGAVEKRLMENEQMNIGAVNEADEQVTKNVAAIEEKVNGDRNAATEVEGALKISQTNVNKLVSNANTASSDARNKVDTQLKKELDLLSNSAAEISGDTRDGLKDISESLSDAAKETNENLAKLNAENQEQNDALANKMETEGEATVDELTGKQKAFLDMLSESGMDLETSLSILQSFLQNGQIVIDDLRETQKDAVKENDDNQANLRQDWTKDFGDLSSQVQTDYSSLTGKFTEMEGLSAEHSAEAKEKLTGQLSAIDSIIGNDVANLGSGLAAFGNHVHEMYDSSESWADSSMAMLQELTGGAFQLEAESQASMDGLRGEIGETSKENAATATAFGSSLLKQLGGERDKIQQNAEELQAYQDGKTKDIQAAFGASLGGVEQKFDAGMMKTTKGLSGLGDQFAATMRTQEQQIENSNSMLGEEGASITKLQKQESSLNAQVQQNQNDEMQALNQLTMSAAGNIRDKINTEKGALEGQISSNNAAAQQQINSFVASTDAAVAGSEEDMSTLEKSMRTTGQGLETQAQKSANNLQGLQAAASAMSREVATDFRKAKNQLHEAHMDEVLNKRDLQDLMEKRSAALAQLSTDRLSQMNSTQQAKFAEHTAWRQEEIRKIMINGETSLEAKKAAIKQVEQEMTARLDKVEAGMKLTDAEIARIHADQQKALTGVTASIAAVKDSLYQTDRLLSASEHAREKMLEDRSTKMKSVITDQFDTVDQKILDEVESVNQEANDRIMAIAKDTSKSEEDRAKEIAAIEAGVENAMKDLSAKQVALDNELTNFETGTAKWNGAIDQQMGMLGSVLKQEQYDWLEKVLQQKEELRGQTEQLATTVDGLMQLLNGESTATEDEVQHQRDSAKLLLQQAKQQLAENSVKHEKAAEDAMSAAKVAESSVAKEQAEVTAEVSKSENGLSAMGAALQGSDDETNEEMKAERSAMRTAMETERAAAVAETTKLLDQISGVANSMSTVAGNSADKQRALLNKLGAIKEVLEAEADRARTSSGTALSELEAQEDALAATANKAVKWEGDFSNRLTSQQGLQTNKLTNLQADSTEMINGELAALGETQKAADGSIENTEKRTQKQAVATQALASENMVEELTHTKEYMAQTSATVAEGLDAERNEVEALKNESSTRITEEMKQDAELHKKVMQVGTRIQDGDLKLGRLENFINSQLSTVTKADDQNIAEAEMEIDGLEKKVSGMSLLEGAATRKTHGKEEAMLDSLETKVSSSEERTKHYEKENEHMRQRLEHMVKAELQRELDAELSGQ